MGGEADRLREILALESELTVKRKDERYRALLSEVDALTSTFWLSNLSNINSLVFNGVSDLNWVGFYLCVSPGLMKLGPFCGHPACLEIPIGRGVCGSAALTRQLQVVPDVSKFPGHIACDSLSQSELVVPMVHGDRLLGVFDIDSPIHNRFADDDIDLVNNIVRILLRKTEWPEWIGES